MSQKSHQVRKTFTITSASQTHVELTRMPSAKVCFAQENVQTQKAEVLPVVLAGENTHLAAGAASRIVYTAYVRCSDTRSSSTALRTWPEP